MESPLTKKVPIDMGYQISEGIFHLEEIRTVLSEGIERVPWDFSHGFTTVLGVGSSDVSISVFVFLFTNLIDYLQSM